MLNNPRETLMEDLYDEFAIEQNTQLEHISPATAMGRLAGSRGVLPVQDMQSLNNMIAKLRAEYTDYEHVHSTNVQQNRGASMFLGSGKDSNSINDILKCFKEVPEIFFRPDFSLMNPATFEKVIGSILFVPSTQTQQSRSQEVDSTIGASSENGNDVQITGTKVRIDLVALEQQEKQRQQQHVPLAYCLDLVEIALLRQICIKSPAFFRTMDDITVLRNKVSVTLTNTIKIRESMSHLEENYVSKALSIPKMARRHSNQERLQTKLVNMRRLVDGRKTIVLLLQSEDYLNAMNIILELTAIYNENNLNEIHCMKGFGEEMQKYQIFICDVMANKFVSMAVQWLEEDEEPNGSTTVSASMSPEPGEGLVGEISPAALSSSSSSSSSSTTKEYMEQLLLVLIKVSRLESALLMFKRRITDDVQLIWRTCALEYLQVFDPTAAMSLLQDGFPDEPDYGPGGGGDSHGGNGHGSGGNSPHPQGGGTLFIQRWREMPADSFLASLEMCFDSLKVSLSRYNNMHKFITYVIQTKVIMTQGGGTSLTRTPSPSLSPATIDGEVDSSSSNGARRSSSPTASSSGGGGGGLTATGSQREYNNLLEISKSCITAACTHALKDTLNLMKFRVESNIHMDLVDMKRLWRITLDFIGYTEKIARTPSNFDFKSFLTAQSKSFLYQLHETYKAKLQTTLEAEKWQQCDVLPRYQQLLTDLSSGKIFAKSKQGKSGASVNALAGAATVETPRHSASSGVPGPHLGKDIVPARVDDKIYRVPWSVLLLIEQVVNILDISESYSDMNLDIISKIVVLCELYDQKTDKLVLGAEAMQSAGLKSITAKHLAVAAQSYDLLLKLLPHVRAFNRLPSGPRSGSMSSHSAKDVNSKYRYDNLDTIMNSITVHHGAILSKFVRIVEDMMDSIAQRCLRPLDWDKMAINGHSSGSSHSGSGHHHQHVDYFEEIQKNINSLYKTLVAVLPITQVVEVFSRIFHVLKVKILQHFDISMSNSSGASKPAVSFVKQPNTLTGKQRVLDEISYFSNVLSRLKHLDTSCLQDLEEVFKERYNINGNSGSTGSNSNSNSITSSATGSSK